jgi:uncharacterized protein YydD (DUF2326 family)
MEKEITNAEILEAVNEFSSKVDERFNKIEAVMVTKDYLDDKLADLRGDLVVLIRKEDTKVKKLVDILLKRNIITEAESKEIFTMEPFAQILL